MDSPDSGPGLKTRHGGPDSGAGISAREDGSQEWPPRQINRNIWRDGLWIGATAFLIITVGAIYQTWLHLGPVGQQQRAEYKGDGVHVPSYGFDLSNLAEGVNPNMIVATGKRKDEVPVLTSGEYITVAENAKLTGREKYLVPTDRVIGVELNGQARAYPIQIMQVHKISNDV
ncbi:MAG: DUF3179 domain-containing protein, partial [bacterium]|nr:DUF3179 domain-containing protein [bacterium]